MSVFEYTLSVLLFVDFLTAYQLQGTIYTGQPIGGERQINVGENTVLELVKKYKNSRLNVCTDNFFTTLKIANQLKNWNMTLVGPVRKNKKLLSGNMQPNKDREILSSNFSLNSFATLVSYVPKKTKVSFFYDQCTSTLASILLRTVNQKSFSTTMSIREI